MEKNVIKVMIWKKDVSRKKEQCKTVKNLFTIPIIELFIFFYEVLIIFYEESKNRK